MKTMILQWSSIVAHRNTIVTFSKIMAIQHTRIIISAVDSRKNIIMIWSDIGKKGTKDIAVLFSTLQLEKVAR
jgi:hypothetical protein